MKKQLRPKQGRLIFRSWRRCPKTGKKLYASAYGFKAWPIWVRT